jgi:hypothetical protein
MKNETQAEGRPQAGTRERLKGVWYFLTEPAADVQDYETRHHARLFASLLVTLVPLGWSPPCQR